MDINLILHTVRRINKTRKTPKTKSRTLPVFSNLKSNRLELPAISNLLKSKYICPIRICKLDKVILEILKYILDPFSPNVSEFQDGAWGPSWSLLPHQTGKHPEPSHHSCDAREIPPPWTPMEFSSVPCFFSDLLHILKDSTKIQIVRTFSFPLCPQECKDTPFSVMPFQRNCMEWKDKVTLFAQGDNGTSSDCPQRPQPGLYMVRVPSWCACCSSLWWTFTKMATTAAPSLCESLRNVS